MRLSDLDKIARRQHGVVARDQTTIRAAAWQRAIAAGTLVEVHRGVARLVGTADTPQQSIAAAVLAVGDGALASHRSAALLHGIPVDDPPPVDIVVPHRIDEIPCTDTLRTLVDLGAVDPTAVHGAVGHALTNDLATLGAIETALDEHARKGRRGVTALRRAVDDWSLDAKPADSVLEPAMRRLLVRYGLPTAEFHAHVGGRDVDCHVIGTPLVIECDGWTHHGRDRDQCERDRLEDAEFAAHGWIVLRFTYRRITTRPAGCGEPDPAHARALGQRIRCLIEYSSCTPSATPDPTDPAPPRRGASSLHAAWNASVWSVFPTWARARCTTL